MRIALRDHRGKIVSSWDEVYGQHPLLANRDLIGDGETFELIFLDGPPPAPTPQPPAPTPAPPSGSDMIDLTQAVITRETPDFRGWPKTTTITELSIRNHDTMTVNFTKRNGPGAWPYVTGPEGGEIQYTLGVGCRIGGVWYLSTSILCISRGPDDNYVPTGPVLDPHQLSDNWYYYSGLPLDNYDPAPGESVAFWVTSGAQRRGDIHQIHERSNVIVVPFQAGSYRA